MQQIGRRTALLVLTLTAAACALSACATTVAGTGRMAAGDVPSSTSASSSPSASASPTGVAAAEDLVRRLKNGFYDDDVAVTGSFTDDGTTVRLDARYGYDDGFIGRAVVSFGPIRMEIRTRGNNSWIQAPSSFWAHSKIPGATAVRSDQWVLALDGSGWPACYGSIGYAESLVLPRGEATVEIDHASTVGGRPAEVLTDSDDWTYTVLDGDTPRVVHAEGSDDRYDISYPTDAFAVEQPAAALVVSVPDF